LAHALGICIRACQTLVQLDKEPSKFLECGALQSVLQWIWEGTTLDYGTAPVHNVGTRMC
jgi:hypothetical protein